MIFGSIREDIKDDRGILEVVILRKTRMLENFKVICVEFAGNQKVFKT